MSKYESVAIPFSLACIGGEVHQCLTDKQIAEMPELLDFIHRFPHCFERSEQLQIYIYKEPDREKTQSPGQVDLT